MTEINNIGRNSNPAVVKKAEKAEKQNENVSFFGNKDIGDIHGLTEVHKYGTINNVPFDLDVHLSDDVSGKVNGKEVNIKKQRGFTTAYKGFVGKTEISVKEKTAIFSSGDNYVGKFGDKNFEVKYSNFLSGKSISGKFGGESFKIEIDRNAFKADDIITKNPIPKDMEEFFPVIYTIAERENANKQD